MNQELIIIEDYVSKEVQDNIERVCFSSDFPWYYNESSAYGNNAFTEADLDDVNKKLFQHPNIALGPQFTHIVFNNSSVVSFLFTQIQEFLENCPFKYSSLDRIKINLKTKNSEFYNKTDLPHVDTKLRKYITGVYYINDSDGDTILYNEKYNYNDDFIPEIPLTVKQKINPKKGKMVFFDGDCLHSAGCPSKTNKRAVINFNFRLND